MSVYNSVENAQLDLEAIDVNNDEYVGYDGRGRLLRLSTSKIKKPFLVFFKVTIEKVVIELAENNPTHASELRERLRKFFSHIGLPKDWTSQASLEDLVTKALEFKSD